MIELTFNVFSLLISIALIIALTFGFLLMFSRHKNYKAERFLALLMFIIAFWNASILILDLAIYRYAIGIIWVPINYTLALGPCFYFYIWFVTDFAFDQKVKIWPHFVPVIFEIVLFFIEVYQGIPQRKGYFQTDLFLATDPIVKMLAIASLMTYGYLGRKRIQKYHAWVADNYSHYHRYNLNWLYRLISIFLLFLVIWSGYFLMDFFYYDLTLYDYYPLHLRLAIISIWLSVEAFSKKDLTYPDKAIKPVESNKPIPELDDELRQKACWLKQKIEQNLLYLDPELSLKSLAETLDIHPNMTSKIINIGLNQTFSDCINEYRVKAVLDKLNNRQNDGCTFLAIAFDCGFNSKTTFNRVFKRIVGKTPLEYKNSMVKR